MLHYFRFSVLFSILLMLSSLQLFAQNSFKRTLIWEKQQILNPYNTYELKENFDLAIFDYKYPDIPFYSENFKGGYTHAEIINTVFEPFTNPLPLESKDLLQSDIVVTQNIGIERKQAFLSISILPLRINPQNGQIEKLVSFEIRLSTQNNRNIPVNTRSYASESVLNTGNWYKMGIMKTGIYKITYSDLQSLGFDMNTLDPRHIRIYGNGGGIVPEHNLSPRIDDLAENPIQVVGEADGSFDAGDYILFYANSPDNINFSNIWGVYVHERNAHTLQSFYFITADKGPGKRIQTRASSGASPNHIITEFDDFVYHNNDMNTGVNKTIKSGRELFGEEFSNILSYDFKFEFPNLIKTKPVKIRMSVIGRTERPGSSSFTVRANNTPLTTLNCAGVTLSYEQPYGTIATIAAPVNYLSNSDQVILNLSYNRPNTGSVGYLNYIELSAKRALNYTPGQFSFRHFESVGGGNFGRFIMDQANPSLQIWDVSDKINPITQAYTLQNNTAEFVADCSTLHEYIAFDQSSFHTPSFAGKIPNQNLHGLGVYDFIILTHPDFQGEAERLAEYRRTQSGMRVLVINPDKIYNEFSSGAQDVSGIRDFIKMFYDRAGTHVNDMPKYLLFFGDGSYDNRGIIQPNTNFIPTFQSKNSINPIGSYVSDDFYGLLDDIEGGWESGGTSYGAQALDVSVGRLPVQHISQARAMVDKIIHYSNPSTFGDWRNSYVLVADDEDNNTHLSHAEEHYATIRNKAKQYNVDKIYLDSYNQISTPAGTRYPGVNNAINQRMNSGVLVINYIGHGGEVGLGHEQILTIPDINSWKNKNNMPVLMTATCSFSRWDDPAFQSAGELALLNPDGGAIALYTTTRVVYAHENKNMNQSFINALFDSSNVGSNNTLGDIFRISKNRNNVGLTTNNRNFTLLGDPSIPFNLPKHKVITDSINSISVHSPQLDTIQALSKVTISGHISDEHGNIASNYNGIIYPSVFDKKTFARTLGQDQGSIAVNYEVQKNVIYKGKASVKNGQFSYTFVVPKDISYQVGLGRLSYYAHARMLEANGSFDSVLIGGSSNAPISDHTGPEINLFLNDESFVFGGITGQNPVLLVQLNDENGINTVGNGIGHNLSATLISENKTEIIDLNDYYEAKLDSYQEGEIRYPLFNLTPGNYKLKLKAWDVFNNSNEALLEFRVMDASELTLEHVLNYPNPFTTQTDFQFEHNKPGDFLQVQVQIFTISGKLVKTIHQDIASSGARIRGIKWDGKDDFGDKIGRGVYVYRLKVRSSDGKTADKYEKLVILN